MDIKFPKEENPFPRTMAVAVFAVIVYGHRSGSPQYEWTSALWQPGRR